VAPDKLRRRSHQEAFARLALLSYGQSAVGWMASAFALSQAAGIVKLDLPHSPVPPNPSLRLLSQTHQIPHSIVTRSSNNYILMTLRVPQPSIASSARFD